METGNVKCFIATQRGSILLHRMLLPTRIGKKIKKATSRDHFILGVISATPGVLGNSGELSWSKKYIRDEWGRIQYHQVLVPAIIGKDGRIIHPARIEMQPMINPKWNPSLPYVSRMNRPEWVAVGLMGKLLIRDDGTCLVNGYCKPNDFGIATASSTGYRVLDRTGDNQILILFK